MSEYKAMALYQNWPKKINSVYGIVDVTQPALHIEVFPATMEGLSSAVKRSSRSDAKLIKLKEEFFSDKELQQFVEVQVKRGIFVDVYRAALTLPGEEK